jgi:hypothetical protein
VAGQESQQGKGTGLMGEILLVIILVALVADRVWCAVRYTGVRRRVVFNWEEIDKRLEGMTPIGFSHSSDSDGRVSMRVEFQDNESFEREHRRGGR